MHRMVLILVASLALYACAQLSQPQPGIVWKVNYEAFPELKLIYDKFVTTCSALPPIPQEWHEDTSQNQTFQQMRNETFVFNDAKYEAMETQPWNEIPWTSDIKCFYTNKYMMEQPVFHDPEVLFSAPKKEIQAPTCETPRVVEYVPRLGCYSKHVSQELEEFAQEQCHNLMTRLDLQAERFTDSRGSTFMPKGGFMECHTNRWQQAGWRFYMHYLPENGDSYFMYKHPYDHSVHRVKDTNDSANLFRIRKHPDRLLWHSIRADTPRFSWGISLPPSLAQHLKRLSMRV